MTTLLEAVALLPLALLLYAYVLYPLILAFLVRALRRSAPYPQDDPETWPLVTVLIPAHDEIDEIEDKLDNTLALDYPADRLQILVASDASTDGTDDVVRRYQDRGVELARLEPRGGKGAAQNYALSKARGEIVVNTDATTRLHPEGLKALVRPFADPRIGVTSGRAVGVHRGSRTVAHGETRYFTYEMAIRHLESRLDSSVGASGALYAARREFFSDRYPVGLSRDFGTALVARWSGFRSVLVAEAESYVPAGGSLRREFGRKVRTMSRGLHTLWYFRRLLDPIRCGWFAFCLGSHKLARWLVYAALPWSILSLCVLAPGSPAARLVLAGLAVAAVLGLVAVAIALPREDRHVPSAIALLGYATVAVAAGVGAWARALRGERLDVWEPTRRTTVETGDASRSSAG